MSRTKYKTPEKVFHENGVNQSVQWWTRAPDEAAASVAEVVSSLKEYQRNRLHQQIVSTRLYQNQVSLDRFGLSPTQVGTLRHAGKERVTFNVVQSVVDSRCL